MTANLGSGIAAEGSVRLFIWDVGEGAREVVPRRETPGQAAGARRGHGGSPRPPGSEALGMVQVC